MLLESDHRRDCRTQALRNTSFECPRSIGCCTDRCLDMVPRYAWYQYGIHLQPSQEIWYAVALGGGGGGGGGDRNTRVVVYF